MAQDSDPFFWFPGSVPAPEGTPLAKNPPKDGEFPLHKDLVQDMGTAISSDDLIMSQHCQCDDPFHSPLCPGMMLSVNPALLASSHTSSGDLGFGQPLMPFQMTETCLPAPAQLDFNRQSGGPADGVGQLDLRPLDPPLSSDFSTFGTSEPFDLVSSSWSSVPSLSEPMHLDYLQPPVAAGYVEPTHLEDFNGIQGQQRLSQLTLLPQESTTYRTNHRVIAQKPTLAPGLADPQPGSHARLHAQTQTSTRPRQLGKRPYEGWSHRRLQPRSSSSRPAGPSGVEQTAGVSALPRPKRVKVAMQCLPCFRSQSKGSCVSIRDGPCERCWNLGLSMSQTCYIPIGFGDSSVLHETIKGLVSTFTPSFPTPATTNTWFETMLTEFQPKINTTSNAVAEVLLAESDALPNIILLSLLRGLQRDLIQQPEASRRWCFHGLALFFSTLLMPEQLSRATGIELTDMSIITLLAYSILCQLTVDAVESRGRWRRMTDVVLIEFLAAMSFSSSKFFTTWLRTTTSRACRAVLRKGLEDWFNEASSSIWDPTTLERAIAQSLPVTQEFFVRALKNLHGGALEHQAKGASYWHGRLNAPPLEGNMTWFLLASLAERFPPTVPSTSSDGASDSTQVFHRLASCQHLVGLNDLGLRKAGAELLQQMEQTSAPSYALSSAAQNWTFEKKMPSVSASLIRYLGKGLRFPETEQVLREMLKGHRQDPDAFALTVQLVVEEAERFPAGKKLLEKTLRFYQLGAIVSAVRSADGQGKGSSPIDDLIEMMPEELRMSPKELMELMSQGDELMNQGMLRGALERMVGHRNMCEGAGIDDCDANVGNPLEVAS